MKKMTLEEFRSIGLSLAHPIVFVEGARMSGKSTLARKVSQTCEREYYTTFGDRKTDIRFQAAAMDVGQATIFIMDFIRQMRSYTPWVADRSTVSTVVFDRISKELGQPAMETAVDLIPRRYQLFKDLLQELNGIILFQDPADSVYEERSRQMGRTGILETVRRERQIYREVLTELDDQLDCVIQIVESL
jgi:nicotinamide riboside kinase